MLSGSGLQALVSRSRRPLDQSDPDDLLYGVRIYVWLRWFLLVMWFAQMNYRLNLGDPNYFPNTLLATMLLALNGYVHYRLVTNRPVSWRWMLGISLADAVTITAGLIVSDGFDNSYFVLYYPLVAMFAVVFTSFKLSMLWVTLVGAMYAAVSVVVDPGLDYSIVDEKVLFTRIMVMYAVAGAVNLVSGFERVRRLMPWNGRESFSGSASRTRRTCTTRLRSRRT